MVVTTPQQKLTLEEWTKRVVDRVNYNVLNSNFGIPNKYRDMDKVIKLIDLIQYFDNQARV
jgi:hypothetical protein